MSFYRHHVFFCTNRRPDSEPCCARFDSQAMRDYMKQRLKAEGLHGPGRIRISMAGCLGRCELGPVLVVYPDGVWYTFIDRRDLDEIIDSHLRQGRVVERLRLPG